MATLVLIAGHAYLFGTTAEFATADPAFDLRFVQTDGTRSVHIGNGAVWLGPYTAAEVGLGDGGVNGTPDYRRTGVVTTRVRVEFPAGIKSLRIVPRHAGTQVDINSGISTDQDLAIAAASGIVLMGYTCRESAAVAATAAFRLLHGTIAAGTEIAVQKLAANGSDQVSFGDNGLPVPNGVSIDFPVSAGGTVDVDLYYRMPGELKVAINALSTAIADSWLAQADSISTNMLHRKVRTGDFLEIGEFEYSQGITVIDLLGDAGITAVDVMGV